MSGPPRKSSLLARIGIRADRDGGATGADLDEEMEKVFAMSEGERFDLARFSNLPEFPPNPDQRRYNEKDYSFHRKKSYPHMHVPLKIMHSRSMRKRSTVSAKESQDGTDAADVRKISQAGENDSDTGQSPPFNDASTSECGAAISSPEPEEAEPESHGDEAPLSSESEAPLSERAAEGHEGSIFSASPDRRVQFDIEGVGDTHEEEDDQKKKDKESVEEGEKKGRRKHRSHKGFRKYSMPEDPVWRKCSGSFLITEGRKMSIQPDEASMLQEVDQDDLASHRFDIPKGKRRFSVKSKVSVVSACSSRKSSVVPQALQIYGYKKAFDHSPHKIFVQLNELIGFGEEREWKETARWIKYEENVEEGAERWGRPHVASLSFHSLLNLRRCLETGVVLLDLEEKDLPGIAYRVVEQMVIDELIMPEDKPAVMRALLLRHRHVDSEKFRFNVRRNTASYTSLQNLQDDAKSKPKIVTSGSTLEVPKMFSHSNNHLDLDPTKTNLLNHTTVEMKEETYMSSSEDLTHRAKESILKRIPAGAEATTVLVGAVDFLEQPTIAFLRLAEGTLIPTITEVTIPVRFMFILLGPLDADLDYHEIGRSISTLMSNSDFHIMAYKAIERRDLLSAINEFLDYSIVLPPGDWETQALLPFTELKAKNEEIRRRQSRVQDAAKAAESKALLLEGDGEKKPPYPDPLQRTRRPFGGLLNDIKRRFPFYISDITDGINCQCFAAAIFIYFAALSAAITFGGLMADKTNNLMGISETLVATAATGIVFALLSGQPLLVIGTTGPLLLFDESLYSFCRDNGIEYLTMRVYIGFWLMIIALLVGCVEGSVMVKLFTRFITEIFSSLISLLYIIESVIKLYTLFRKHPLMTLGEYCSENSPVTWFLSAPINTSAGTNISALEISRNSLSVATANVTDSAPVINQPNTALFCTILALGTFFIAYYLRHFRNSKFLGRSARRALGDFGVPIAIIVMVVLDYVCPGTYTEKLKVPEGLSPSNPAVRGWVISPWGLMQPMQVWVAFAAGIPALLVYILLFMETHISELIIDKKDRNLKKGSGFHLDIVLVCILNVGCGLMGAPFMCAATVRSVTHVSAVTVMSRTHAPGDKPHIVEVKEQRLSALVVSILVGASVLMSPLLRLVPMAVLFGVFLYMGISSINGIQFFERMRLFFMPVKHHSQANYVRRVQTMKMHLFTIIQMLCLVILWIVKSSPISLAFPFFLILMVPLRAQLQHLFTPQELRALDSDEPDAADQEDEPDFYTESLLAG